MRKILIILLSMSLLILSCSKDNGGTPPVDIYGAWLMTGTLTFSQAPNKLTIYEPGSVKKISDVNLWVNISRHTDDSVRVFITAKDAESKFFTPMIRDSVADFGKIYNNSIEFEYWYKNNSNPIYDPYITDVKGLLKLLSNSLEFKREALYYNGDNPYLENIAMLYKLDIKGIKQ